MSTIENIILYYADYLSLRACSIPITDNCKYFYINGQPINIAVMTNGEPFVDTESQFIKQAMNECDKIKKKFGESGMLDFVTSICNLKIAGTVNGEMMLKYIHQYSSPNEKNKALKKYRNWKTSQKYTHTVITEDGYATEEECTKYVAHATKCNSKRAFRESA